MNVSEANDFFAVLRSCTTDATPAQRDAGIVAAERLTKRARQAVNAGPVGPQVAGLVVDLQDAVRVAAEDPEWAVRVDLTDRPVETATAAGGVL